MERKITIATVYKKDYFEDFQPYAMDTVRWVRISESLADLGFKVDMVINGRGALRPQSSNLRYVSFSEVKWAEYDIIKTLYHRGHQTITEEGVTNHPFIISRIASVVGSSDDTEGVHFYKDERKRLYELQMKVHQQSRYVSLTTEPSKDLWEHEFGHQTNLVMVPTGVDRIIPGSGQNPYKEFPERIVVYIGNIRATGRQKELNLLWQERLNSIGRQLKKKRIRLCFVGVGEIDRIDNMVVTCLGPVRNNRIWDYQYFADAGITMAQGKVQNHDSSKIYYYLRAGLPVVSEDPIPNNHVIREANLGLIADYGDDQMMADMIEAVIFTKWDAEEAIRYMIMNHTWDKRVEVYERVIRRAFGLEETARLLRAAI